MTDKQAQIFKVNTKPATGVVGGIYFVKSEKKTYIYSENGWEPYNNADEATHATNADKATTATKLSNKLTAGSKTYDGSAAVSLTKSDLGLGNVDNTSDADKVVASAKKLEGFSDGQKPLTWGHGQNEKYITDLAGNNGGDIAFTENGTQMNCQIDGFFYQNEGRYKVLDENTGIVETSLHFGNTNLNSAVSPIDIAIFNEFSSNRLGFFDPDHISVEYSRDGGTTWIDYGATDSQKLQLVTQHLQQASFITGKASTGDLKNTLNRLKIAFFDFNTANHVLYCSFRKFAIYVGTNDALNCWVTVRKNTNANPDIFTEVITKQPISGWSYWNILNLTPSITTYSNNDSQSSKIEFIFGYDSIYDRPGGSPYLGLSVYKIYGIAETLYSGSVYQKLGVVYETLSDKSIRFPADLSAGRKLAEGGVFIEDKYVKRQSGKQLSTNDYTTAEKNKLAGLVNAEALTNDEIDTVIK